MCFARIWKRFRGFSVIFKDVAVFENAIQLVVQLSVTKKT